MKSYITLVLVLVASTTAMAFEFEKVDPASAGFDAKKLDTIKANFEDLYKKGVYLITSWACTAEIRVFT
jgi:hypothetical protein